ncbi:CsbD family protein [Micromonospora sp. KC606]|uniref:CsbD family protein n=1 Tax=Micromonospora sp. KC606 TaxID=2530379 RepID=UPI00104B2D7E|nr:CsbD family protein [Micromonospora sp. KC606]TDC83781.1 CsbD family protein [Micromonospora sp. KC606]
MRVTDRAKSKAEELAGVARERIGDVTDNERLRAEGAQQQSAARAGQAGKQEGGEDVRDATR